MTTGLSIYFGTDNEKNQAVLKKAKDAKMSYAFTSLHLPEEQVTDYRESVRKLLEKCREYNLNLIADISPATLGKLNCQSYDDLVELGFDYIRLDYGFSNEEVIQLSEKFHLVFNGSTLSNQDIQEWKAMGADFTRFTACHNFYPKPLTGLSLKRVKEINQKLRSLGFMTMSFVAGDQDYRGPLYKGLPTVEEHRNQNVFFNMLQLFHETESDVVLIGDIDVSKGVWNQIREYNEGFITLRADILEPYCFVKNMIHHDRPDSSDYLIRSQESRLFQRVPTNEENQNHDTLKQYRPKIVIEEAKERKQGAICISNELYLRYEGELEIARLDLEADEKVNVIGYVKEEDIQYLPYIKDGFGFVLK